MMTLTFHTDPGHGWLYASYTQLDELGLSTRSFTRYSYYGDGGVYAEEDCDAAVLVDAHKAKFGCEPELRFVDHKYDAFIRQLSRC